MHQACYHGRPENVKVLIELSKELGILDKVLAMPSNPCGRAGTGLPIELAQGGEKDAHKECETLIRNAYLKDTLIALYLNTKLILFTF
jgi:hypothetical protein